MGGGVSELSAIGLHQSGKSFRILRIMFFLPSQLVNLCYTKGMRCLVHQPVILLDPTKAEVPSSGFFVHPLYNIFNQKIKKLYIYIYPPLAQCPWRSWGLVLHWHEVVLDLEKTLGPTGVQVGPTS